MGGAYCFVSMVAIPYWQRLSETGWWAGGRSRSLAELVVRRRAGQQSHQRDVDAECGASNRCDGGRAGGRLRLSGPRASTLDCRQRTVVGQLHRTDTRRRYITTFTLSSHRDAEVVSESDCFRD